MQTHPRPSELTSISKAWEITDQDGKKIMTLIRINVDYQPDMIADADSLEILVREFAYSVHRMLTD
ncbi:MAG: hypothetical protein LBJ20_03655 [Candidatus Methanoplasma sp.]|nr:hypothetical protein [Candidatus Methanoplasma sp.]